MLAILARMDSAALMDLWNAVEQVEPSPDAVPWLRRAHAALVGAGTIERYMRPSPTPGIAKENGGRPGAYRQMFELWDAIRRRVVDGDKTFKYFVFVAANQVGKSTAIAVAVCLWLRDYAKPGAVMWVIAQTWKAMRDIPLKLLWQLLPRKMFGNWFYDPSVQSLPTLVLFLPNGGTAEIWFKTEEMDLAEFESSRVDLVWWTEARRHAVWDAIQPRLMARDGMMFMDVLPCEPWHRDMIEEAELPNSLTFLVRAGMVDNQHNLPPGTVENMKPKSLGGRGTWSIEVWNMRGLGIPSAFEGIVFKQFDPQLHWRKPFKIPEYLPLFMGADWGYRNPHAFLLAVCMPDEHVIGIGEVYGNECTVFEVCRRLWAMLDSWRPMDCGTWGTLDELLEELAKEQVMGRMFALDDPQAFKEGRFATPVADHIRSQWKRVLPHGCVIDASVFDRDQADGTALSDEFERCGFPVVRSVKQNKVGGVEMIRRRLEQYTFSLFNSCPMHRRDLMTWRYKENKDRIPDPADQFEKKNDHGAASVMYLLRSSPTYSKPVGEVKPRTVDEVLTIHDPRTKLLVAGRERVGSEKF